MKVRMLVSRSGYGFSHLYGDIVDLPDREALNLIKAGQAEGLEETASVDQQRTMAVKRRGRPRKKVK